MGWRDRRLCSHHRVVLLNRSALAEAKVRIGDVVSVAGGVARVQLSDDVTPDAVAVPAALRLSLRLRVDDLVAVAPRMMPIFESEAVHLVAHTEAARAALAGGKDLCVAATSEQLRAPFACHVVAWVR